MTERKHRIPIVLSAHSIALLSIFTKGTDYLDDLWAHEDFCDTARDQPAKSAKQFIDSLENHWSPSFLMALRDQITATLREHDNKYGTKWAEQIEAPSNGAS